MSMEEKLDALRNRNVIHEETGIEDNGTKPSKISAVVRAQRLWDRLDLLENHKMKDLEVKIDKIETELSGDLNRLEAKICELSTYNGETEKILTEHETALKGFVIALNNIGFVLLKLIPAPDLSPVSPEDLII